MFLALVLRSLRGWLQDYVGLDLDHSDYAFEHVSHSHVRFELKDVVLTSALWRFLVGPILPLTVQEGQVDQVKVEVNPEKLSVHISGVQVKLRKLQPEEWCPEAEAYKKRLLKEKHMFASGSMAQTELRRWIKAKISVSVLDAKAVLEEPDFGPCAVLGYLHAVHVADPDHSSWTDVPSEGVRTAAPWDVRARDEHMQMAKDVLISGIRGFFLSGPELERLEEALRDVREAQWESAALCPELQVAACYRNFDYGALQAPELAALAQRSARRVLTIKAQCQNWGAHHPMTLKLSTESYKYLTGFLANMDSLYFMWSACLTDVCKVAGRKPSLQEAERYISLWKQYLSGSSLMGRGSELWRLEEELLWGFCQRLRRLAEEEMLSGRTEPPPFPSCCNGGGTGSGRFCQSPEHRCSTSRPCIETDGTQSQEAPYFEEELHRSTLPKLSPQIPEAQVLRCLSLDGTGVEDEPEAEAGAEESPVCAAREFLLDSVYKIELPCFRAVLDFTELEGETASLEGDLPDLEIVYSSHLDCRFLSVSSSCGTFSESHFGSQSHNEAFRGAAALHWERMRIESTNFGEMKRQVRISSNPKLNVDLRRLWLYLRHFPGLRDNDPYLEAIRSWFPDQNIPDELSACLSVVGASRQTTWMVDVPLLRLPLGPEGMPVMELIFGNAKLAYSSLYGVHSFLLPEAQVFFHGNRAAENNQRSVLLLKDLEVNRLGDLSRNWAQVQLQNLDVDVKPFQLMLLVKHLSMYDPQIRFSSSSSKESKASRPLPQMSVMVQQVSVRLWQSEMFDAEAKMQLHLHMLEFTTVKNLVVGGANAEGVVRLKLKGLIGHSGARAGGRSVYLCSALEGALGDFQRNALELTATWTPERKRIVLVTMELHFSPTQGLVDAWHLLMPMLSSKDAGQEAEAVPTEYRKGDARPVDSCKAQSQVCLVIQDVDLHLHFGSAEYGAALALSDGLQEACAGRPAAARVCARLTVLEAEATSFEGPMNWRPGELCLKRLALAIAQVPATGEKELHASGLWVAWLAVLQDVKAAAILDNKESGVSRCRSSAFRCGKLSVYSTGLREDGKEEDRLNLIEKSELIRFCPKRPMGDEEPYFFRLLKLQGTEKAPFLSLSWQGVWWRDEEKQNETFHSMEPHLKEDGTAVFTAEAGSRSLCSRYGQSWSLETSGLCKGRVEFHLERQVLRVDLAPTLLLLRRMDLLPVLRLLRDVKELSGLAFPKEEADTLKPGMNGNQGAPSSSQVRWQLFLRADVEARLAELPGCPSLKLRCTPAPEVVRGTAKTVIRLEELSLELLAAAAEGHGVYAKALAHLGLDHLHLTLSETPNGREVSIAVNKITATHGCEKQIWLRQINDSEQHLLFKYCPRSLLDFQMEPTALRLHCAWATPVASLFWGLSWWRQQSRLQEPSVESGSTGLVALTQAEGPEIAEELQRWCGTVWVLQSEPTVEVQAPHAVRKALQIQPDGSLWARREASGYWMPLLPHSAAAANYRHFSSSVFPFGLCCTSADFAVSSCCSLAFDSEDEKNVAVRIFTNLFLQRLRKSTPPPAQSIPSSTRQGNRTRTSMTSISDRVRGFNRARTVTSAAMAAASRLGNRSPASFRTGSPFSRLSPTSPAQASMASVGSDEVAEAAAAAAAAAAAEPKKSMAVHVQLKGLEFWLPSEVEVVKTAQDAILEDDNRELGILVVASGEGDTGNSVQVNVEHFAAVCVPLNSCWWPDVSIEEPFPEPSGRLPWPELRLLPEAAPSGEGQGIMSSFGPLEVWMQSEVPSPLTSPARPVDLRSPGSKSSSVGPMVRPARPVPSALHDLEARSSGGTTASLLKAPQSPLERLVSEDNKKTALQCLARGEAVEGQLVETRALQMMLLWEPDKLIGIRLESVFVNVPLELIRWWRGFKEHTLSFLEFGRLGSDLLQAPQTSSHWAAPMQLPASRGPLRPQLDQEAEKVRKWPTLFSGAAPKVRRASTSTLVSEMSTKYISESEAAFKEDEKFKTWRLELDSEGQLQFRLSGGILAPSQWVALRITDFHVRGALSPAENDPLSFLLTCDVVCHHAAAAQLLPWLEQFEVTVDVERKRNEICCTGTTARVNVNIDRVLVDFFRTVKEGLKEMDGSLQPVRSFNFHNGTGVPITVKWRQGRRSTEVQLLPGMSSIQHHLNQDRTNRLAEIVFWLEEFQDEGHVTIELDHVLGRAYQLREGCPIFVEPDHNVKEGFCTLNIKSALTIYNDTSLPLKLTLGPAAFQRFSSQVSPLLRSSTRMLTFSTANLEDELNFGGSNDLGRSFFKEFSTHLHVPAHAAVEVPVSWFVFSRLHRPNVRLQALGPGFGGVSRHFPELATLLEEVSAAEDEDFDDDDASGATARLIPRAEEETERRGDRTKFSLFLRTYMKLSGYIDAQDMPLALDEEDVQQVQRFKMHLGNLLAIRNMLPFPVVLQMITPDNSFKDLPMPDSRSVQEILETRPASMARSTSQIDLEIRREKPVRCFAQVEPYETLVEHTQLDGIGDLAMTAADRARNDSRGLVTYALHVDEEVALPFAKRHLRIRCLALDKHLTAQEADDSPTSGEVQVARAVGLLKLPAVSANRPHHEHLVLESPSGQTVQVSLELTRDSVVLFVPFMLENLTPLTLTVDRDDSIMLKPGCRSVLPTDPQRPDTAFFSFLSAKDAQDRRNNTPQKCSPSRHTSNRTSGSASTTTGRSLHFAVPFLSDVGREHRFYAVDRRLPGRDQEMPRHGNPPIPLESVMVFEQTPQVSPRISQHRIPVLRGLVVDSLSFGTCVRTAAAPLRRTKVLSLFPRFFVKSELEDPIELAFEGSEVSVHMEPGDLVPVHPPNDRERLFFRSAGVTSQAFSFKGLDGVERCRTFHVSRDRQNSNTNSELSFVQVDVQKTTFPAKNHVPLTEGYFLVLRKGDFRCAEDLLFHFDNQTPHSFFATISGLQSMPMASQKLLILTSGSQLWQHLVGFQDPEQCLKVHVKLCRDNRALRDDRSSRELVSQSLGHAVTSRLHAKPFALEASLRLTHAWYDQPPNSAEDSMDCMDDTGPYRLGRWRRRVFVTGEFCIQSWKDSAFVPQKAMVELILEDLKNQKGTEPEIFVAGINSVKPCPGEDVSGVAAVRGALRDKWQVSFVSGEAMWKGSLHGLPAWRQQLIEAAEAQQVVELQTRLELRFSTSSGGVHRFTICAAPGWSGVREEAEDHKEKSSWTLTIHVPILSVSWIHRHEEVLALRLKGIRLEMGQHANERNFDIGMQHLQVDHFIDGGELPVVLNRRFLHINSRWLREKAVQITARWIGGSHIIKKLSVSMVPYWLNLELGVLIRLLDLAESMGFREASPDEGVRVPLEPPQQPSSLADAKHMEVWRLETLVVEPLRLTIMVRSPDVAATRDNTIARRIRFLPVDMPNMDLKVDRTVLTNQFGSIQQILGTLGSLYKRKARNSALLSVMLSYMAAILKGSMNALWWLARGPYDALDAANQNEGERDWFFWVDPLVQGLSEGTYRAFAELVGNALFGVVLILNSIRQVILGVPRPRAQSFLDGILQGFFGLVVDTFLTPMRQLVLQTQIAYHDWGISRASLVFCLCLLRVFLGPFLGLLHLCASILEGLANLLLHEEAQFAPFELQRAPEPEPARTLTGVPSGANPASQVAVPFQSTSYGIGAWDAPATPPPQASTALSRIAGGRTPPANSLGAKSMRITETSSWWRKRYSLGSLTNMLADDDAVMDRMQLPVQYALNP